MAGIGFELRKLTAKDDLLGIVEGYGHAALATSGPWLFTIIALAAIVMLGLPAATPMELANFRAVIVCNFGFSLMLTSPVAIITTRYLADSIHAKDVKQVPAVLFGSLALIFALTVPIAAPFYLLYLRVSTLARLAGLLNFLLISGIWLSSVFLTALKNYRAVTVSFGAGLAIGIVCGGLMAPAWSVGGMLMGFNMGLTVILFALIARILAEYPTPAEKPFAFVASFRNYWELAAGALAYNAGVWVDKWILWMSPQREALASGLFSYSDYDSAMFLAYLSIVPSMAAFTLAIETSFFEKYLRFYGDIQRHVSYEKIARNQRALIQSFLDGARNFLVIQGSVTAAMTLLAPRLFEWLRISFVQLAIFRMGLLGAFFHGGVFFLAIIVSYLDERRLMMYLSVLFLATNGLFTLATLHLGFPYYGCGYALSTLTVFGCGFVVTARLLNRLPYQTFVRNNSSITSVE